MHFFESKLRLLVCLITAFCLYPNSSFTQEEMPPYLNTNLSIEARVEDMVDRMTLEEKVSQTISEAPAITRLGIPEYNWWSEGLHGVARAGLATVFPQAIGLAATWDQEMMFRVSSWSHSPRI